MPNDQLSIDGKLVKAGKHEFVAAYFYPFQATGAQVQWLVDGEIVQTEQVNTMHGASKAQLCLSGGKATVEVRLMGSQSGPVLSTHQLNFALLADFPRAQIIGTGTFLAYVVRTGESDTDGQGARPLPPLQARVVTPDCTDDVDYSVSIWRDLTGTAELGRYLHLGHHLLRDPQDPAAPLVAKRFAVDVGANGADTLTTSVAIYPSEDPRVLTGQGGTYAPTVTPMVTDVLDRSFDRLLLTGERHDAIRFVEGNLAASLRRHALDMDVVALPRDRLVRGLSTRYSDAFVSYAERLFAVVDAREVSAAIDAMLELLEDLSTGGRSHAEAALVLSTAGLVMATIDYFADSRDGGREAWSNLRFDSDSGRLVRNVDALAPARAALGGYLGMLASESRVDVQARLEISQHLAVSAAVQSVRD